jgi:PAS domain S-box-containing protein
MRDQSKTKEQTLNELVELRQRVAELEVEVNVQKHAKEILQEYHKVIESSQDMIAVVDQYYRYVSVNAGFLEYRRMNREQVVGKSIAEVLGKDVFEKNIKKKLDECFRGEVVRYQMKHLYPELGERRLLVSYFPIESSEGINRVVSVIRDITDLTQAEEMFRESEKKFRQLAENIGEVFYIADPGFEKMIYVSPAYERIWGCTVKSLYENPKAWMEAIHPADRQRVMAALPERIRNGLAVEYRIVQTDGSIRWIWDQAFPMRDASGKVWRVAGIAEDITQRKQIEEALHTSEEEAKRLAHENGVIAEIGRIISSSLNINEVYKPFSEKVKELIPFDRIAIGLNDLEGNTHTVPYVEGIVVAGRQPGDIVPHAGTTVGRVLKPRKGILIRMDDEKEVTAKFPGLLPDFRSGLRSGLTVPLISRDQAIGALSLRSMDSGAYTDRDLKLAESIAHQIAGAIANSQLFAQRQRLEERLRRVEKMEALGTLAGRVAHDLNNILSGIVGYPGLILMQLPDDSPLRESILAIKQSGEKAAAVVQDLLTLARRDVLSMEVVNWNSVISDYMKSPEQEKIRSLHPRVRFEVLLESDLLPIKGSRVHLSTTLMNLLSNAAEAIPESGVVTIATRNQYLDRPVTGYDNVKEGDYVVLEVSDTGRGISTEDMSRIFEPFFTKKVAGRSGTGLGLAVVWGAVMDHNGYIDVQSEEGRRTTFALYFPVTREALALDQSQISLSDYMGKGESILVVDDVREQRELVVAMLNKLNYRVTSVSSGEEAIETVKVWQRDLVILDMIMDPGIDGLETYRRILELHPGQKAIIVSGFSETERVRQALDLGAGAFVKKPYGLEKIGQVVRLELGKHSLSSLND